MKIKYVSYVGEGTMQSLNKTHENILEKLSAINTDENSSFEFCKTHGEMLKTLGEGFSGSDVTVLLIDVTEYIRTKSLLFKAMNIRCVKDAEVVARIKSDEDLSYLNEKQVDAQSAMPKNAEAFVTGDGLFSGFGIESASQKLVVLPIDEKRVDEKLLDQVFLYISKDVELIPEQEEPAAETVEEQAQEALDEAEEIQQEDVSQEEEDEALQVSEDSLPLEDGQHEIIESEQNQPLYAAGGVDDLVAETFTNIGYSKIKIAFGVQEGNITVDEFFRSKIVFRNTGLFTIVSVSKPLYEENEQKCKAELSQIARSSMLNANASIGMAVSEVIVDEQNRKFVLSAMCDARKTNIYKVFALPDENDEDIIISAIGNMFAILNARVMEFNERQRKKNEENEERYQKQKKEKKSKAGLIVLIIILVLLLAAVAFATYSYFTGSGTIYEMIEKVKNMILSRT